MKKLIIIFSISALLILGGFGFLKWNFSPERNNKVKIETWNSRINEFIGFKDEDYRIINLALDATIGHDSIWRKYFLHPPAFIPPNGLKTKSDSIDYNRDLSERKIKQKLLDTANLFVFINDSFISLKDKRQQILQIIEPDNFKSIFPDIDTSFRKIIIALIKQNVPQNLDIQQMDSKFKYQIRYKSQQNSLPKEIIKIGDVNISMPVINSSGTKSCIYSEINCGGLCGEGGIFFFEKKNKEWEIVGYRRLWVA